MMLEEPEVHLHPSLVRNFIMSLQNLNQHKQFIITTHNCDLVDALNINSLKRVVSENGLSKVCSPSLSKEQENKFYKFVYSRHVECFFAKKVIISEGLSEKRLLPDLSNKIDLKYRNKNINGSLDINQIQLIQIEGGNFYGPIPLLKAFKVDWVILGDKDKWPVSYMKTIEKTGMHKQHKKAYAYLKNKESIGSPLTKKIQKTLYRYFNIISLPKEIEDLLVTNENARYIRKILKQNFPDRHKSTVKHNPGLSDIDYCRRMMKKDKPEWAIIIAREMPSSYIPQGIHNLIKLIVCEPKDFNI